MELSRDPLGSWICNVRNHGRLFWDHGASRASQSKVRTMVTFVLGDIELQFSVVFAVAGKQFSEAKELSGTLDSNTPCTSPSLEQHLSYSLHSLKVVTWGII